MLMLIIDAFFLRELGAIPINKLIVNY